MAGPVGCPNQEERRRRFRSRLSLHVCRDRWICRLGRMKIRLQSLGQFRPLASGLARDRSAHLGTLGSRFRWSFLRLLLTEDKESDDRQGHTDRA